MLHIKVSRFWFAVITFAIVVGFVFQFVKLLLTGNFQVPAFIINHMHQEPLIVFYTPLVVQDGRSSPVDFDSRFINNMFNNSCSHSCRYSLDASKSKFAHVVVHNINIVGKRKVFRAVRERFRTREQIWVMYSGEPPTCYIDEPSRYPMIKDYANLFNWTWTYRRDSDIHFPFGAIVKRATPDWSKPFDRFETKTEMAVAMISHCYSPRVCASGVLRYKDCATSVISRDNYINELIEAGLQVDVIGDCRMEFAKQRNLSQYLLELCQFDYFSSASTACEQKLGSTYKFYLAFENSLCLDYVTEKTYRAASLDLIPVVRNGANMSLYAPEGSYINVNDFASTILLVKYLKRVASDSDLYNSFFKWKPYYDVEHRHDKLSYLKNVCDLCRHTHEYLASPQRKHQSWPDIEDWFLKKSQCTSHLVVEYDL